jgi:hypothetical protein
MEAWRVQADEVAVEARARHKSEVATLLATAEKDASRVREENEARIAAKEAELSRQRSGAEASAAEAKRRHEHELEAQKSADAAALALLEVQHASLLHQRERAIASIQEHGRLRIRLTHATGLRPADTKAGTSNPFISLQLGGRVAKSQVVPRTLNPRFDSNFIFRFDNVDLAMAEAIKVEAFDQAKQNEQLTQAPHHAHSTTQLTCTDVLMRVCCAMCSGERT